MNKLEGLRWVPRWVSHLGCLKGCLDYLNVDVSDAWLFGATGHAFILHLHDEVCPSGPTAWGGPDLTLMGGSTIGYKLDGVGAHKSEADFGGKRKLAWEKTRQAIENGLPCYGWELEIPEYYVFYGYSDVGYYFSGAGVERRSARRDVDRQRGIGDGVIYRRVGVVPLWATALCQRVKLREELCKIGLRSKARDCTI